MRTDPADLAVFRTSERCSRQLPDILTFESSEGQFLRNKESYRKTVDEMWRSRNEEELLTVLDAVDGIQHHESRKGGTNDIVWVHERSSFRNGKVEPPSLKQVHEKDLLCPSAALLSPSQRRKQIELEKKSLGFEQVIKKCKGDRDRLVRLVQSEYRRGILGGEDLQMGQRSEIYGERHVENKMFDKSKERHRKRRQERLSLLTRSNIFGSSSQFEQDAEQHKIYSSKRRVSGLSDKHWSSQNMQSLLAGVHRQPPQNPHRMARIFKARNPRGFDIINGSDSSQPPYTEAL